MIKLLESSNINVDTRYKYGYKLDNANSVTRKKVNK